MIGFTTTGASKSIKLTEAGFPPEDDDDDEEEDDDDSEETLPLRFPPDDKLIKPEVFTTILPL